MVSVLFVIAVAILPLLLFAPPLVSAGPNNETGAFIDGVRFIQYLDDNVALEELKIGRAHV